jgi:hypothetical protein
MSTCAVDNGGCAANATCTDTGPGTRSCACNPGFSGDGLTCAVVITATSMFPAPGSDLSSAGGYVVLLTLGGAVTFSGTGSATLYDVTAGTSVSCPLSGMSAWGPDTVELTVDDGATHSPPHTYAVEISSDLIPGFAGISDTATWTWLR